MEKSHQKEEREKRRGNNTKACQTLGTSEVAAQLNQKDQELNQRSPAILDIWRSRAVRRSSTIWKSSSCASPHWALTIWRRSKRCRDWRDLGQWWVWSCGRPNHVGLQLVLSGCESGAFCCFLNVWLCLDDGTVDTIHHNQVRHSNHVASFPPVPYPLGISWLQLRCPTWRTCTRC